MDLDAFRAQFPVVEQRTYLITGAIAPASAPVHDALTGWTERLARDPLGNFDEWPAQAVALRRRFARLIGADESHVAITDGTSRGAWAAIELLAGRPQPLVLADPTTYPTSLEPWRAAPGKEVVVSPRELDPDAVARLGAGSLAAVVISHVDWRTGYRHDLRALSEAAHAQDGVLLVDAAQSAGIVPIDVADDGIDVLVTTAMKWLLGVAGVGFLYLGPRMLDGDVARRQFEPGVPSLPSIAAAHAGMGLLAEAGVDRLAEHVEVLVSRCLDGLAELGLDVATPRDPRRRAGVISIRHPAAHDLAARLRERRIDVMAGPGWGFLRVDPAGFNRYEEIDRFLEALAAALHEVER